MLWHGARLFYYHPTTIPPRFYYHTQVPIYACYSVLSMLWHGALALDSVRECYVLSSVVVQWCNNVVG